MLISEFNKVKDWISNATGLKQSNETVSEIDTDSYDSVNFDANIGTSSLGNLDIATQLPKLSTNQIAKIIGTHFKNSSVISEKDAQGIYNAQQTTNMSALAILGIKMNGVQLMQ